MLGGRTGRHHPRSERRSSADPLAGRCCERHCSEFVVDRLKDLVLTAGYNVCPAEIERVLMGHPGVALVAGGREPDEVEGEVAHVYVVPAGDRAPQVEDLMAYCHERLSEYKVPRAIHFVDQLPTTSSGKLMRRLLRQPAGRP